MGSGGHLLSFLLLDQVLLMETLHAIPTSRDWPHSGAGEVLSSHLRKERMKERGERERKLSDCREGRCAVR